jgi:hypothetical protein
MALALGVAASYLAVNAILHAFGTHSKGQPDVKPVLLAHKAQAGAN